MIRQPLRPCSVPSPVGAFGVQPPPNEDKMNNDTPTYAEYEAALALVLAEHARWREDKYTGRRLDLSGANLSRADLSKANLSNAYLAKANLTKANLSNAYLTEANLWRANLSKAYLSEANLSWANLFEANLSRANLTSANLSEAVLSGAIGVERAQ